MLAVLPIGMAACTIAGLPSQQHPSCSWSTQPPSNAGALCTIAFNTLTQIVQATEHGDNAAIRRVVTNPTVARRIIAFGTSQRASHAHELHVVPSFTLEITSQGYLGAGFYLLGKNDGGNVNSQNTVYMRVKRGRATVVEDPPGQDW